MGKTSARAIRLRTLGQSYKKTLTATNVFSFLVKKSEKSSSIILFYRYFY